MRSILTIIFYIFLITNCFAIEKSDFKFIKKVLNDIQAQSFSQDREFCGYIYIKENDDLGFTKPTKGDADSCLAKNVGEELYLLGSYHSHGAFSLTADTELPSLNDLQADIEEGVDGFISTPGGRIWHIDSLKKYATMLCGLNCIAADPRFDTELMDPVEKFYTLRDLEVRESLD